MPIPFHDRRTGQVLYHGTNAELALGETIKPGQDGAAYATGSKWYAIRQARKAAERENKGTARVYQVKPVGQTTEVRTPLLSETDKPHLTSSEGFQVLKVDLRDASINNKSLEPINKIIRARTARLKEK